MKVTNSSLAHIAEVSRRQFATNSERSRLMPVETISTNTAIAGKYFTSKRQLKPMLTIPETNCAPHFLCLPVPGQIHSCQPYPLRARSSCLEHPREAGFAQDVAEEVFRIAGDPALGD